MLNQKIKTTFLFLTLIVLLIGVVSAEEISKDTSTTDNTLEKNTVNNMEKNIVKKDNLDNTKTGSSSNTTTKKAYTTTANNYKELVSKVNAAKKSDYTSYTINLKKGTYNATQTIEWKNTKETTKLVINGNNSVINGLNKYKFLEIGSSYTVNIKNITLKNFKGEQGGAINNQGTLTITNSKLTNNTATKIGGALYSSGELTITNSIFNYNTAEADGGAIYLDQTEDSLINRNSFTSNIAGEDGGAVYIYDSYDTSIKYNNFTKNMAKDDGGAIANIPRSVSSTEPYTYRTSRLEQVYNPFKTSYLVSTPIYGIYGISGYSYRTQYIGGYDYKTVYETRTGYRTVYTYYGSNTNIVGNNFIENRAEDEAGAILISHGKVNITKNKFQRNKDNKTLESIVNDGKQYLKNIYKYSKSNPILDNGDTNITSNTFDDRKVTKFSINKLTTIYYNKVFKISGKLLIGSSPVKKQNVTITVNNKKQTVQTSNTGYFKLNVTSKNLGKNNLTISYAGSNNYMPVTNKTSFTVNKRISKITISTISDKTYKDKVTITGKFSDKSGIAVKNTVISINVNGKVYTKKTDSKGVYTLKITANKVGTNNITVSYKGSKYYQSVSQKTTYKTVSRPSKLSINQIGTTSKGSAVKITGKLVDNLNSPVMNSLVKVSVAGKVVKIKTNSQGVYAYNYKASKAGSFTATVNFGGSTNYKASSIKTTFKVK